MEAIFVISGCACLFALPDRLPSLILLVGFWILPAVAGWVAAGALKRNTNRGLATVTYALLAAFVLGYGAGWFFLNLSRMPPYIPGATTDPTFAPPTAVAGLAFVASVLVLPGSALACALAFRYRRQSLKRLATSHELADE